MQDGFDDARTNRSRFYLLVVRLATARFEVYGANEFSAASDSASVTKLSWFIFLIAFIRWPRSDINKFDGFGSLPFP